jgi:hypothetical protein
MLANALAGVCAEIVLRSRVSAAQPQVSAMKACTRKLGLMVALGLAAGAASAQPAQTGLELLTVVNQGVSVYGVTLEPGERGVVVFGKLRKSAVSPSRRLYQQVWAEVVDRDGRVVAVHYAPARRSSPAKHSSRAHFDLVVEDLPPDATALRMGYGWHG